MNRVCKAADHPSPSGLLTAKNAKVGAKYAKAHCARPLHAEEIAATLSVARSNVSTSLRELQGWGIIKVVHVFGERRDHFESMRDVWEMFRTIADERKRREMDPTLEILKECLSEAKAAKHKDDVTIERLEELHDFFNSIGSWYTQLRKWPNKAFVKFAKIGDKILKALNLV